MKKYSVTLHNEKVRAIVMDKIKSLPADGTMVVDIKPYEENRSLAQNNLMWIWMSEMGETLGYTKQGMYDAICLEILGTEKVKDLHGVIHEKAKGTSGLKVSEMAMFLTQMEALAGEYGVFLSHPEDKYYRALGLR